jgi:hypothetical protein
MHGRYVGKAAVGDPTLALGRHRDAGAQRGRRHPPLNTTLYTNAHDAVYAQDALRNDIIPIRSRARFSYVNLSGRTRINFGLGLEDLDFTGTLRPRDTQEFTGTCLRCADSTLPSVELSMFVGDEAQPLMRHPTKHSDVLTCQSRVKLLDLTSKHLVFPQPAEAEVRPQP